MAAHLEQIEPGQLREFRLAIAGAQVRVRNGRQRGRIAKPRQQVLLGVCGLPERKVESRDVSRTKDQLMRFPDAETMFIYREERRVAGGVIDGVIIRDAGDIVPGGMVRPIQVIRRAAARGQAAPGM